MVVGAPLMAVATLKLPRRTTMIASLVVFALGHVVAALSSNFAVVLSARVVTVVPEFVKMSQRVRDSQGSARLRSSFQ